VREDGLIKKTFFLTDGSFSVVIKFISVQSNELHGITIQALHDTDRDLSYDTVLQNPSAASSELNPQQRWDFYTTLISDYATRKLLYDHYNLNAPTSILQRLQETYFPAGFIFGHPREIFRHALL
jgi:hypothetical protein